LRTGIKLQYFSTSYMQRKRWSNHITALDRPWRFQDAEALRFQDSRHMKVERLSDLHTGRLYPPGNIPGTHFYCRLSQPEGHATRRIMSMKISIDTIGNRTRNLPAYSKVPQPTIYAITQAKYRIHFYSQIS
jgi:hypothetical protein